MPVEDDIIPVGRNLLCGNWGKIDRIDKGQFKIQVKKARLMEIEEIVMRIGKKQARKSSEDTHFTEYARFEKVWAG